MEKQRQGLFQQKALDRLRSPDELDRLFAVTPPVAWVALVAVLLLVFSGILWSIFGVMAVKVTGTGLIIDSSGVVNISSGTGGRIVELRAEAGDRVQKGQLVAVIEQFATEQEIARLKAEMNVSTSRVDLSGKAAQLNSLNDKLQRDSQLLSPYSGIVAEQKANVGDIVNAGTSLYSLRLSPERGELKALVYVPVLEGKKVQPGMTVQLSFGADNNNEYGSLIGRVSNVSDYPVSNEGITTWVGSKEMSNWILQRNGGAAVEIQVDLIKDPDTVSGYLWSSISGAPEKIAPGTTCTASIVVKRQPPITKAFYKLNQWLRSD